VEEEEKAEEEGEAEEEAEVEEEMRGSLLIGNSFSFVIRSRQTLRDRPAVERRISLKRCYKTVGPRWRQRRRESSGCKRDGNPSTGGIRQRHPDGLGRRSLLLSRIRNVIVLDDLMSTAAKDPRINDLFTEGSHNRNLSVLTLNQNLFCGKPHAEEKLSLPSTLQQSHRSTTHRDARKTDVPLTGPRLFIDIRRSHEGTLLVPGRGFETGDPRFFTSAHRRIGNRQREGER
jgi:hypothetical protein